MLKASPKFVVVNEASFGVEVRQEGVEGGEIVRQGERMNWVWAVRTQPKNIQIRAIYND